MEAVFGGNGGISLELKNAQTEPIILARFLIAVVAG